MEINDGVREDKTEKELSAPFSSWVFLLRRACSISPSFHTTSYIAVAPFLQHPAVAIRIGEVGEAGIVSSRGVEPRGETSVPGPNGRLVAGLTHFHPAFEQPAPRGPRGRG